MLQKGARVSPRIFLIPKPGCQPDTNKLKYFTVLSFSQNTEQLQFLSSATSAHKSDPVPGAKMRGNEKQAMAPDL